MLLSVAWVAFKVGALSFGGGFVIVPLMQSDAVSHYHWMTGRSSSTRSRSASDPGPVVQTVAVVGYAAGGLVGGFLASVVAFSPSFAFVLLGAAAVRPDPRGPPGPGFLDGAGPRGSAPSSAPPSHSPARSHSLAVRRAGRRGSLLLLCCAAGSS